MTEDQEQAQQDQIDSAKKPTDTQLRMLEYIANGCNQEQVSRVLGVSHETTRKQLMLLRRRLKVNTLERAIAISTKHGWIRVDDYPRA